MMCETVSKLHVCVCVAVTVDAAKMRKVAIRSAKVKHDWIEKTIKQKDRNYKPVCLLRVCLNNVWMNLKCVCVYLLSFKCRRSST
jgi:hypothetical protein